jgi:hypothetical protein
VLCSATCTLKSRAVPTASELFRRGFSVGAAPIGFMGAVFEIVFARGISRLYSVL